MIERAQFQPTQAMYKVYIIDEVHMLSKGAFNALLKTLEEPPKHVKFILATTEIHKIPDTIISRAQRFDFKKIKNDDIIEQLHAIAQKEKIEVEESALELIARLAKWGMRDAITLFEQYSVGGILKRKYIEENLELIGDDFLSDFSEAIIEKDTEKTLKNLIFLRERSLDVRLFIEQLLFFLRDKMKDSLKKPVFGSYAELFDVFEGIYGRLKFSPDPFLLLETSVFRSIVSYSRPAPELSIREKSEPKTIVSSVKKEEKTTIQSPEIESMPTPISSKQENLSTKPTRAFDFSRFIEHIRTVPKRSFVGLGLRVATYSEDGNKIIIHPDNDFNYNKLNASDVRLFLQEVLDTLFGTGYQIDIQKWVAKALKKTTPSLADEASDIF